ncbi:hypothetical protein IKG12_01545 [Candidatus Saccharibacteria bacterium]|nr:hypothetical protein [Candidatus Saccharibacteria bacterium]
MEYIDKFQQQMLDIIKEINPKAYDDFMNLPMATAIDQLETWEEKFGTVEDARKGLKEFYSDYE